MVFRNGTKVPRRLECTLKNLWNESGTGVNCYNSHRQSQLDCLKQSQKWLLSNFILFVDLLFSKSVAYMQNEQTFLKMRLHFFKKI